MSSCSMHKTCCLSELAALAEQPVILGNAKKVFQSMRLVTIAIMCFATCLWLSFHQFCDIRNG